MSKQKKLTFQAQAEQLTKDEAFALAKGIEIPGQTKEQTKQIARGIEKGIALYKKQEKGKARERAKRRKKRDRQTNGQINGVTETNAYGKNARSDKKHSKKVPLAVAGLIFSLVSIAHVIRYLYGLNLIVSGSVVPLFWSLPAAAISALLALWMFWSLRNGANSKK